MNKKISLLVLVVCALLIVLGVVSIFLTEIGGVDFGNGESVIVFNYVDSDEEFAEFKATLDAKISELGLRVAEEQNLEDFLENLNGISYDFISPDQEKLAELQAMIDADEDVIGYYSSFDNTAAIRSIWFVAIGMGIALILQFVYCVIFQKATKGVHTGIAATLTTLLCGGVTFGIVCILGLCGIKASIHSISAVVGVMTISIFVQAYVFARANRIAVQNKLSASEAFDNSFEYSKNYVNGFAIAIQITLLFFLIVGSYAALSFILPALIGITCLLFIQKYLLPILYKALIEK